MVSVMPRSRRDGAGLEDGDATAESFDAKVALIREEAGDRFGRLVLNTLIQEVVITDRRLETAERMAKDREMTVEHLLESPLLLTGTEDELAEQLIARRQRYGIGYFTVFERHMAAFVPVIDRLTA